MKILCETQIVNRQMPAVKNRPAKSTLAIGFHPPNKENSELFIIHFTAQYKTGTRYKVKGNLEKVFTKFINDGKATISLKQPEINILIKCNPVQLKSFLQTLKLGLEGKNEMNNLGLGSLATTAIPQKNHPVKNFVIRQRGDYPIKGIPKTIESLTITGIQRAKFDTQILFLKYLTKLNLTDNCIKKIPKELGQLPLVEFDVSKNVLGESNSTTDWNWLQGLPLQSSLKTLNLSENKLSYFPYKLVKLKNLVTLKMANNEIRKISFAIRRLANLRFLHLSNNALESLPSSVNQLYLDTLDVWDNKFLTRQEHHHLILEKAKGHVPSLWEIAARTIVTKRLPYSAATIPWILVDLLSETPMCACGRLCFSSEIHERASTITLVNVRHLVFSRDRSIYQDCVVCSERCAAKLN